MDDNTLGLTCALLAALVWAFAMIFFKLSGDKVHPLALNLFKNTIAIILLTATLGIMGEGFGALSSFSSDDFWILALSGFIGITIADTLFFYSLNLCGVGIVSIVDCLYSPFIIFFAFLMLGEVLTPWQLVGAGLVLAAVFITTRHAPPAGRTRKQLIAGILIGVANMALMGFGVVMARPVLEYYPMIWAVLIRMAAGTAILALFIAALPGRRKLFSVFVPRREWKFSVIGSVLGAYLSSVLWIGGFKYTEDASPAAILNQMSSLFALVLAALFLKEAFTKRKFFALMIALGGIALVIFCEGRP